MATKAKPILNFFPDLKPRISRVSGSIWIIDHQRNDWLWMNIDFSLLVNML